MQQMDDEADEMSEQQSKYTAHPISHKSALVTNMPRIF
jgi:hypothetical protein